MKLKEVEAFYKTDQQQYLLVNRPGFALWYHQNFDDNKELSIDELQELVDKAIAWYVFRYPNRLLNSSNLDYRFKNTKDISSQMDFKQLLYRLSSRELSLLECKYYTNDENKHQLQVCCDLQISRPKTSVKLDNFAITEHGNLSSLTQTLYNLPFISVEEFYEQYKEEFDMTNVLKCIDVHNKDLILRNHIVDAIRQGLLYYVHTTPEYGRYRMDKFTSDITSYYEDIDLENKKYVREDIKTLKPKGLIKRLRGDKK